MTPLQRALAEGRLTWGAWTRTDEQGRRLLCMLSAMSPDAAEQGDAHACPAHIAPPWLAHLIPWMSDAGSDAVRPQVWARVADLQARWLALWPDRWPYDVETQTQARARLCVARSAREHATPAVRPTIESAISLLEEIAAGALWQNRINRLTEVGRALCAAVDAAQSAAPDGSPRDLVDAYAADAAYRALDMHDCASLSVGVLPCVEVVMAATEWADHVGDAAADALTTAILDVVEAAVAGAEGAAVAPTTEAP